jgi:hypothetical protein
MSNDRNVSSTAWYWYLLGSMSALIMGLSAFVISFNFMSGQVPLLIAVACALSGLLLNTALYWRDSAHKLNRFAELIRTDPSFLLRVDSLLNMGAAACVGFLAIRSYSDQMALLPAIAAKVIPLHSLIVLFSIANSVSTFVLFYDMDASATTKLQKETQTNQQGFWRQSMKRIHAFLVDRLKRPIKHHVADVIGTAQSIMFSLTNLCCVHQVLTLYMPMLPLLNIGIATTLATALVLSEIDFNTEEMRKLVDATPQRGVNHPRWRDMLLTMVGLNAFANGWIALGDFAMLPQPARWSIVSIGSLVSFAVMRNLAADISELLENFSLNRSRYLPLDTDSLKRLCNGAVKLVTCAGGLYLLEPTVLMSALAVQPVTTFALLALFSYQAAPVVHNITHMAKSYCLSLYDNAVATNGSKYPLSSQLGANNGPKAEKVISGSGSALLSRSSVREGASTNSQGY